MTDQHENLRGQVTNEVIKVFIHLLTLCLLVFPLATGLLLAPTWLFDLCSQATSSLRHRLTLLASNRWLRRCIFLLQGCLVLHIG
jgi:hypothetical protein